MVDEIDASYRIHAGFGSLAKGVGLLLLPDPTPVHYVRTIIVFAKGGYDIYHGIMDLVTPAEYE